MLDGLVSSHPTVSRTKTRAETSTRMANVMEKHALKNVNSHCNANIFSYLQTSGGQSSYLHLTVVHFFNTSVY